MILTHVLNGLIRRCAIEVEWARISSCQVGASFSQNEELTVPNHILDRVAQQILAVLYSSNHIDVTIQLRSRENRRIETQILDKIQLFMDSRKSQAPKLMSNIRLKDTQIAAANIRAKQVFESDFEQNKISLRSDMNAFSVAFGEYDIGPVFRAEEEFSEVKRVSEIDNDTVAVAFLRDTLYVACNYKIRRDSPEDYKPGSFNDVSPNSLNLVKTALIAELCDGNGRRGMSMPDEEAEIAALEYVIFVGLKDAPTDKESSAKPHAEMQLVNYFESKGDSVENVFFGVSKECCCNCAGILDARRAKYSAKHERGVKNWSPPNEIVTVMKHIFMVPN